MSNTGNATGNGQYENSPSIINDVLTLTAITNSTFNYIINVTGTMPINIEAIKPNNYDGNLKFLNNNTLNGVSYNSGIFNIKLKAVNIFGFDIKTLVLTVNEPVKILNTNLEVYSKLNSPFSYVIDSSGLPPKSYYASAVPGLYMENNIIKGTFTSVGIYNTTITVSNGIESDSKILTINVGLSPNITSSTIAYGEINQEFNYQITDVVTDSIYKIEGILPKGIFLRNGKIEGIPIESCKREVNIKSINAFGESIKRLTITIYK